MQKVILIVLVSMFFVRCIQSDRVECTEIRFKQYHLWLSTLDSLHLKDSAKYVLEKRKFKEKVVYNFKYLNESLTAFDHYVKGDSLFFGNQYCPIIDTIALAVEKAKITLFVSEFDESDAADEESYLYWNFEYGLLGQYNWSMGPVLLFEPNDIRGISDQIYNHIVKAEKEKQIR